MTDWSKIAADAARDDWSPEARRAALEARKRNAGEHLNAAQAHHERAAHHDAEYKNGGPSEHRDAREKHKKAAGAHEDAHKYHGKNGYGIRSRAAQTYTEWAEAASARANRSSRHPLMRR